MFAHAPLPVQANVGVSLTPMAALPVPTHRAAAVNKARRRPVSIKVASTVQVAVRKFAKNAKRMGTRLVGAPPALQCFGVKEGCRRCLCCLCMLSICSVVRLNIDMYCSSETVLFPLKIDFSRAMSCLKKPTFGLTIGRALMTIAIAWELVRVKQRATEGV